MAAVIKKNWDHGQVTLSSTSAAQKIGVLNGGESITVKGMVSNSDVVYIGEDRSVTSSNGYELDIGETITLEHDISFGRNSQIEIWAIPASADDVVCYIKLIGKSKEKNTPAEGPNA